MPPPPKLPLTKSWNFGRSWHRPWEVCPAIATSSCVLTQMPSLRKSLDPDTLRSKALGLNSEHLRQICFDHGLIASHQFSSSGTQLHSWTSPTGNKSLIDYVAVLAAWGDTFDTFDCPCLGDMHAGIDHEPILVQCRPTLEGAKMLPRRCPDWQALQTPEGQAALQKAWATLPPVSWDVDATSHVALIHQHLRTSLLQDLPRAQNRPRNPALADDTLALIKYRRHLRRCERSARQVFAREVMGLCFRSWQAQSCQQSLPSPSARALQAAGHNCRRWFARVLRANAQVGAATGRDRAAYFRQIMRQPQHAGPAQFAFLIRALTRQGRKFKPAQVLRPVRTDTTETTDHRELKDLLGRFFAVAELAEEVDVGTLLSSFDHRGPPETTFLAQDVPCLADLASGFAQLKVGRAPGLSGLVPEVFRSQPVLAAIANFPVAMKTYARGHVPAQWAGGLAATVPKPGKDSCTPEGWRAILLLESDSKALQKAVRPQLLHAVKNGKAPAQFGGIPGCSLTLPSAILRAHLLRLHHDRICGGAVFVDVKTAYYSVVRDILSATEAQRADEAWISSRACFLFRDPILRSDFSRRVKAGNPLVDFGASPATLRYVQSQVGHTWFASREDAEQVFRTGTGTAPGAPIADTLFALVFRDFLLSVQQFLTEKNLGICLRILGMGLRTPRTTMSHCLLGPMTHAYCSKRVMHFLSIRP